MSLFDCTAPGNLLCTNVRSTCNSGGPLCSGSKNNQRRNILVLGIAGERDCVDFRMRLSNSPRPVRKDLFSFFLSALENPWWDPNTSFFNPLFSKMHARSSPLEPASRSYERWLRRRCEEFIFLRRAASRAKPRNLFPHFRFLFQVLQCFTEYARRGLVLRHHQSVMHPLTLTTRSDNSGAAQISEMS